MQDFQLFMSVRDFFFRSHETSAPWNTLLEMFALTKQLSPRDPHLVVVCPREAQHTINGALFVLFLYSVLKSWAKETVFREFCRL